MCMMKSSRQKQALKIIPRFQDFCPAVLSEKRNHWAQNNLKWRKSTLQVLKAIYFALFFFFLDAKFVLISRKAHDDDKTDKKRKISKKCSFFIIVIVSIFFCLATPFLLFTFLGQMQPHQTILEKSSRKPTTEEFHLLVDEGNYLRSESRGHP